MPPARSSGPGRPSLSGVVLIVTGSIFLLFAAVPFGTAEGEVRPFAFLFGGMWVLVCLSFIVYGIYILSSKKSVTGMVLEVEGDALGSGLAQGGDFASRLRSLENLREDHLITEDEYRKKRAEIVDAPW